jgi:hypothetical protein
VRRLDCVLRRTRILRIRALSASLPGTTHRGPVTKRHSETSSKKAELLLAAARYLNETLELERVYDRFRELLA